MPEPDGGQRRSAFSWIRSLFSRPKLRGPDGVVSRHALPVEDPEVRDKLRVQVNVIRSAFGEKVAVARGESDDDADVEYLYRPGHVVARSENVDLLHRYFDERKDTYRDTGRVIEEPVSGLALFEVPTHRDTGRADVLRILGDLDRDIGMSVAAPDHVIYVTHINGSVCPATEPELPPSNAPVPARNANEDAGTGVRVSVVDTGWWAACAKDADTPWLKGVTGDPEQVNTNAIQPYAGHGTFVSGVIRCIAPATQVEVKGFLTKGGAVYESEIVKQLDEAMMEGDKPALISVSAGSHTRKDLAMISFEVLAELHDLIDGERAPLVVAAAGNDGNNSPFWPAAFDWVVGVGALDDSGVVSDFSNYGPWVDAYALGRNLVNAFPTGTYTCYEPAHKGEVRKFTGLAQWSGTSFSTPVITGALAAHMYTHHATARHARDALLKSGKPLQDKRAGTIVALGPPFL